MSYLRALCILQALAYRAKRHEAEACLEELRADVRSLGAVERQQGGVGGQGRVASVTDEVQKLQEVVWQQEQEQRRLEVRAAWPKGVEGVLPWGLREPA